MNWILFSALPIEPQNIPGFTGTSILIQEMERLPQLLIWQKEHCENKETRFQTWSFTKEDIKSNFQGYKHINLLLLDEFLSKFIAYLLILAYWWCASFYCTENVELMTIQHKVQMTLKVSMGQIKLINGQAGIIATSHYVKLFYILGLIKNLWNPWLLRQMAGVHVQSGTYLLNTGMPFLCWLFRKNSCTWKSHILLVGLVTKSCGTAFWDKHSSFMDFEERKEGSAVSAPSLGRDDGGPGCWMSPQFPKSTGVKCICGVQPMREMWVLLEYYMLRNAHEAFLGHRV